MMIMLKFPSFFPKMYSKRFWSPITKPIDDGVLPTYYIPKQVLKYSHHNLIYQDKINLIKPNKNCSRKIQSSLVKLPTKFPI